MAEGRRWQGRTGGGKFGQAFLLFIFRFVRVSLIYPVLFVVIPFYILFGSKGRRASYAYYRTILGYPRAKARRAVFRNYMLFGRVVLDKFALAAGRSDLFKIDVDGREKFEDLLDEPGGCLIVGSHIGNMEIAGNVLFQDKKKIIVLVYGGEHNKFQKKRFESSGRAGLELVPVNDDMSHFFTMVNNLMEGNVAVVACDRIPGDVRTVNMDFMGHGADIPLSTFIVAAKLKVPVLSIMVVKDKGLRYKGFVTRLEGDPSQPRDVHAKALARDYVKSMEAVLRNYPDQWFNYFDFWNLETAQAAVTR